MHRIKVLPLRKSHLTQQRWECAVRQTGPVAQELLSSVACMTSHFGDLIFHNNVPSSMSESYNLGLVPAILPFALIITMLCLAPIFWLRIAYILFRMIYTHFSKIKHC